LARDTELSCRMEVGHARLEACAGKADAAEARLRSVMARPAPSDPSDPRLADTLFLAREALAEVLAKQGRHEQADKLLVDLADDAIQHARRHPDRADIGRSWAVAAYEDRIRRILERDRGDLEAARKLIAEFQQKFPDAIKAAPRRLGARKHRGGRAQLGHRIISLRPRAARDHSGSRKMPDTTALNPSSFSIRISTAPVMTQDT